MARYRRGLVGGTDDGRLFSPSFARNAGPVSRVLATVLGDATGTALEIGSGTGQHVCAFAAALPRLRWTASDPDATHRNSIAAWIEHEAAPVKDVLPLDAASDWADDTAIGAITPLSAIVSLNVIHIAPWSVAEGIVAGADRTLGPGGWLFFYGPFRKSDRHTSNGNAAFDAGLRAENAQWGVRDCEAVADLAASAGLGPAQEFAMPSNNAVLAFQKPG